VFTIPEFNAVAPVTDKLLNAVVLPIAPPKVTPALPFNVKPNAPLIVLLNPIVLAVLVRLLVAAKVTELLYACRPEVFTTAEFNAVAPVTDKLLSAVVLPIEPPRLMLVPFSVKPNAPLIVLPKPIAPPLLTKLLVALKVEAPV
jgi:hypothetical protein